MKVDPAASMRCWAIDVELGGRTYTVPALPAADWWPVLLSADPTQALDFLMSTDLDDLLLAGELTGEEVTEVLTEAIEEAAGRSLHVACVLALMTQQAWTVVGGHLAQHGFRWDLMPLGAALDAVYAIIMDTMDKDGREKFTRVLKNETLTTGKPKKIDRAKVVSDFEMMAGPRPSSGVRSNGAPSGGGRSKIRTQLQQPRPDDPSPEPRKRPARPARNGRPASSVNRPGAAGPASA